MLINLIRRIWLPRTLPLLAVWMANFALEFADVAAGLGVSGEVATVNKMNDTVQWLNASQAGREAIEGQFRDFRDMTLHGTGSDPTPNMPSDVLPAPPEAVQSMILTYIVNLVENKIKTADSYDHGTGMLLGVEPVPGEKPPPSSVKPIGTYDAAAQGNNYALGVLVSNRGESDAAELQCSLAGGEIKWRAAKTFTGKTVDARIEPPDGHPTGKPFQVMLRIQLYKNNQPYGQPSDVVFLTLDA